MFKIKNVAKLLLGTGAVMVSLHTAAVMFGSCAEKTQCLASVYFGVPDNTTIPIMTDLTQVSNSSSAFVLGNTTFSITDIYTVVQVTGLYLILLGIVGLIIFQLNKLPAIFARRLVRSR
jgi:hypothetical protein